MVVALSAPRGAVNRKHTFFPLIFKILWSTAAAADPDEGLTKGWRRAGGGSGLSLFESSTRIFRRPKGRDLLGPLRPQGPRSDISPLGGAGRGPCESLVLCQQVLCRMRNGKEQPESDLLPSLSSSLLLSVQTR